MKTETVLIPASPGHLIDRITILRIKARRSVASTAVRAELDGLLKVRDALPRPSEVQDLERRLHRLNAALWDCEDAIRGHEHRHEFGARFVRIARLIPRLNDRRAAVKRRLDVLLASTYREEKHYNL